MTIKLENLDVRKTQKTKNGYLGFFEIDDGTPIKIYSKNKFDFERGDIVSVEVEIQNDFFFRKDK